MTTLSPPAASSGISPGTQVLGQVRFDEIEGRGAWGWLGWWLFVFAALVVVGFAALALFPVWATHVTPSGSGKAGRVRIRRPLFLTEILGLPAPSLFGPFAVVRVGDISLDYIDTDGQITSHTTPSW